MRMRRGGVKRRRNRIIELQYVPVPCSRGEMGSLDIGLGIIVFYSLFLFYVIYYTQMDVNGLFPTLNNNNNNMTYSSDSSSSSGEVR
jgi:hypothetical protein